MKRSSRPSFFKSAVSLTRGIPYLQVFCCLFVCIVAGLNPVAGPAQERAPVTIGIIAPLSQVNADRGEEIRRTVALFEEQLRVRKLKQRYRFVFEDGRCGVGSFATTAAYKFLQQDQIRFLIAGCSGETIQAGLLAQRHQAVLIGVLASDPAVREIGDYVFRTYVDIADGISQIADKMKADGRSRIAVLTEDVPFTQKIEGMLKSSLSSRIIFADTFPASTMDFDALLTKARGLKADALYFNCAAPLTEIPLVNKARALGLRQPIYTYFMPGEPQFQEAVGKNAEGIIYVDVPDVASAAVAYQDFVTRYQQRFAQRAIVEFLQRSTYDALTALVNAIESAGPDAAAVRDALYESEFEGALGRVKFDAKGDVNGLRFILRQVRNGKGVLLE